jgi:hypothetical protein
LAVEENSPKSSKSVSTLKIVVSPNPLSPIPSTYSATNTPDPQSPGPSASLVKTEETPENIEKDPDVPEPTAEADIQMK